MKKNGFSIVVVLLILALVGVSLAFYLGKQEDLNILEPTSTPQVSWDIEYEVPTGWRSHVWSKHKPEYSDSVTLYSPDEKSDPIPQLLEGAQIDIVNGVPAKDKTSLYNLASSFLPPDLEGMPPDYEEIEIDNKTGIKMFICWEGCGEHYYILDDEIIWKIVFSCADCVTKEDFLTNEHYTSWEIFIKSIRFK